MDSSKYKVGPESEQQKGDEKGPESEHQKRDDDDDGSSMMRIMDAYTPMTKGRVEIMMYWFDSAIAKRKTQIAGLASIFLVNVVLFGILYWYVNVDSIQARRLEEMGENELGTSDKYTIFDGIWDAWTFMADPGTHAGAITSTERALAFIITAQGILFFSIVLGLIVDAYQEKMEELKTGRSKVVERNHTLILGWSDKAIGLIKVI
jgi:hypothetical protein